MLFTTMFLFQKSDTVGQFLLTWWFNFILDSNIISLSLWQHAKKVLSDSPGLVDFAIGLVNSVFNLPDGLVMFYEEFE